MIKIRIPGKPTGKQRARTLKTGFSYTPEKTINYENLIKLIYRESGGGYMEGPLKAQVKIVFDIPKSTSKKNREKMMAGELFPTKKPDIDNVQKIIFDALNGIAYKDDTQIILVEAWKKYGEQPYVEVTLEEVMNDAHDT